MLNFGGSLNNFLDSLFGFVNEFLNGLFTWLAAIFDSFEVVFPPV